MIVKSIPKWLEWFANNHLQSHIHLLEKYLMANPYYIPNIKEIESSKNSVDEILITLVYDKDFLDSLSNKGLSVWYYSDFSDFLEAFRPFATKNKDLYLIYRSFNKNIWWFDRVYSSIRTQIANQYELEGKSFK